MTEAEWLASEDPASMLEHLMEEEVENSGINPMPRLEPLVSERKLRLFACAMLRQFQGKMAAEAVACVAEGEGYADGAAAEPVGWPAVLANGNGLAVTLDPLTTLWLWDNLTFQDNRREAAALLREIVGNPFAKRWEWPKGLLHGSGYHWSVIDMAGVAYERRMPDGTVDNSRLLVLSDALEEEGWGDAELLSHLRSPGPHVRGCWAVDLLLGKS